MHLKVEQSPAIRSILASPLESVAHALFGSRVALGQAQGHPGRRLGAQHRATAGFDAPRVLLERPGPTPAKSRLIPPDRQTCQRKRF